MIFHWTEFITLYTSYYKFDIKAKLPLIPAVFDVPRVCDGNWVPVDDEEPVLLPNMNMSFKIYK